MTCIYFSPHRIQTTPINAPAAPLPDGQKEAFFKACREGDLEAVEQWCLQFPDSVNVKDENGQTGLMVAALARKVKVATYFVKECLNFEINAEDNHLRNALFHACISNDQHIGIMLINNHIKIVVDKTGQYANGAFLTKSPNKALLKRLHEALNNQDLIDTKLLVNLQKKINGSNNDKILVQKVEAIIGRKVVMTSHDEFKQVVEGFKLPVLETKMGPSHALPEIRKIIDHKLTTSTDITKIDALILTSQDTQLRVKAFVEEHPSLSRTAMIAAFKEETGVTIRKSVMKKYIAKYGLIKK